MKTSLQALAFATLATAAAATAAQPGVEDPVAEGAYPVVLTPARLRQSLQDVPASVSIVTADMLRRYGITSVVEALRLVPGMQITRVSGNDYRVNYHGSNSLVPRRMNVMIDGVSVYQPAFARVDWASLPVNVIDIDRIEVTRGANSAAYGPNSMMAVVNIITKHPEDVERATALVRAGTDRSLGVVARLGASLGDTALRLSVSKERDSGYDQLSRGLTDHDSSSLARVNLRTHTPLGASSSFALDAAYVGGSKDEDAVEPFQRSYPDMKPSNGYVAGTLTTSFSPSHELVVRGSYWVNRVRQEWTSCPPTALLLPEIFAMWRANPAYARAIVAGRVPSGGTAADDALARQAVAAIRALGARALQPTCADTNQNLLERRVDVELQDTYVVADWLRLVGGAGARRLTGDSATYLGGEVSNSVWYVFGNVEAKAADALTFNAGAYVERDKLSGEANVSPRVAANLRLSEQQVVRVAWTSGARTPDLQEQRAQWSYAFVNAAPPINGSTTGRFFQSAESPGGLRHERNRSLELGYLVNVPTLGLIGDVRLFDERLTDLISEKLQLADFRPTNGGSVRLRGAELQASMQLTPTFSAFAHYTYLDNEASNVLERTQYSRHSGAIGASHALAGGWSYALAHYGASGDGLGETSYGRTDLTLSKALSAGPSNALLSFTLRRLDRKTAMNFRDVGSITSSSYDDRLTLIGQLSLSF